ncbi:MAG: Tetratricopeptide repeat protein [Verrucomicrobiales bacterium]|nr:Tetratricopeptide repeat protein [Verrucomicrobiales bacterium]
MLEKTLQQISKAWRDQYEKGMSAFKAQNLDYAISIFNQVLASEPGFFDCRQALRAAQFKKAGTNTGFFKKVLGGATSSPLMAKGQLALRNNPIDALQIAEQILNDSPSNSMAQKLLADAARAAGFPKTAILSLEILYKSSPKDRAVATELAEAYSASGQSSRAEDVYRELLKAYPHDPDLSQALKNVAAQTTMDEGGYGALADGTGSYRDILRNKEEAVALEQEKREVKTGDVLAQMIYQQETKFQSEPDNLKLARSIAELYVQQQAFDRALEYYNYIIAKQGTADPTMEKTIADTMTRKFDHQLSQLDTTAPDYTEQSERIKGERDSFVIEQKKKQVDRYPNDLQLRFDLGQEYFRAGRISEAMQELQKAQANPNRKIQSLGLLGQCFAHRGMNDMAARTLQNALKEKVGFDEEKKELLYVLGCVFEKMGQTEQAMEHLKQIYEVDIGYKDVAAKVDAYYSSK